MEGYQKEIREVVDLFTDTKDHVARILSADNLGPLKGKLLRVLDREISAMSVQNGFDHPSINSVRELAGPITKLFGKVVGPASALNTEAVTTSNVTDLANGIASENFANKQLQPSDIKTPDQIALEELKATVKELYPRFATMDNDSLLDTYSELEIRAIGKMAGLPFTETEPKKITSAIVTNIKKAILKKREIEAGGNVGNGKETQTAATTTTTAPEAAGKEGDGLKEGDKKEEGTEGNKTEAGATK